MEARVFSRELNLSENVRLSVEGTVQIDGGIGILARPEKDIELLTGFGPGTPSAASGTVAIALEAGAAGQPTVLLGTS